jgi:lipoate---protein ligase
MKTLRILDTGLNPARWNVGMTAALAELHRTGRVEDTLRFYRFPSTVLIGRHQNLRRAVNADRCARRQVQIARRVTGGASIYVDPGILAFDLVLERQKYGARLSNAIAWVSTGVAAGIARMGLPARFQPSGSVVIDTRQVGSITATYDGLTLVFQGFVHIDFKAAMMADILAMPGQKRRTAELAQIAERTGSLADFLGRVPADGEVANILSAALANELRLAPVQHEVSRTETDLAARLADQIGDPRLFVSFDGPDEGPVHVGRKQATSGFVEAHVRLRPGKERRVDQVRLAGDFSIAPAHAVQDLERALQGVSADTAADYAREILQQSAVTMSGVAPVDIAAAIAAAVRTKPLRGLRSP